MTVPVDPYATIGHPDWTEDGACPVRMHTADAVWFCTRPTRHRAPHAAGDGDLICAVWQPGRHADIHDPDTGAGS